MCNDCKDFAFSRYFTQLIAEMIIERQILYFVEEMEKASKGHYHIQYPIPK